MSTHKHLRTVIEDIYLNDNKITEDLLSKLINEFKKIYNNNSIQEIKVTASYKNINAIEFYKKNSFNESELTLKLEI